DYSEFISEAFDSWTAATGDRLAWTRTNDRDRADIVCYWSDKPQFIGTSEDAGQTDFSARRAADGTNIISHVRIGILTKGPDGKQLTALEVRRTCLHEIGHALGIKDHSP